MASRRPPRRASAAPGTTTVASLIERGTRRLSAARLSYGHGTTSPREEAAWLLAGALGLPPDALPQRYGRTVAPGVIDAFDALLERRRRERSPAAYLLGEAWLGDRKFFVDERVIVPRSHIAGLLLDRLVPWIAAPQAVRAGLDLCTGSGCLAVLLARAFPAARVDAADISAAALEVAAINVRRHRLGRRVRLIRSDLFAGLRGRRYDLIVCNPPYVTAAAMRHLPPEYRHEPALALAGGPDGLDFVRRILWCAARFLGSDGVLVMEVGSARGRIERAFPRLELVWPELDAGHPVFIATRAALSA